MRPLRIHLIPNDWPYLEQQLNYLTKWVSSQGLTPVSSPTFEGLTLTGFSGVLKATDGVISGGAAHSALASIGANDHHNQVHTLDGADHSVSGLTAGDVLQALTPTTFGFATPVWIETELDPVYDAWYNSGSPTLVDLTLSGANITTDYTAGAETEVDAYDVNNDATKVPGITLWTAQTFTTTEEYNISSVDLLLYKGSGSPTGIITVEIRKTSAGKPTSTILCSSTVPIESLLTTPGSWINVAFTPTLLSTATQYAIVVHTDLNFKVNWCCDSSSPAYGTGAYVESGNAGATWLIYTATDMMFRTYKQELTYSDLNINNGQLNVNAGLKIGTLGGILLGTAGVVSAITNNSANWDTAYTNRVDTWNYPLSIASNVVTLGYNTTNLKLTANQFDTIQGISSTASPTFVGLTLGGIISNTMLAANMQGLIINGDAAPFQYAGTFTTPFSIKRTYSGSGSGFFPQLGYFFQRNLTWNYSFTGTAKQFAITSGPSSSQLLLSGRDDFTNTSITSITANGTLGAIHPVIRTAGNYSVNNYSGSLTIADVVTRNYTMNQYGGYFSSNNVATYTINGSGVVTCNFYGGYFTNEGSTPNIVSGNPVFNYYGGAFISIGSNPGTSYGGYFSATGGLTNWAIYSAVGDNFFGIDNAKSYWGTGLDLQIYHDGTNSYIYNDTGILKIQDAGSGINLGTTTAELLGFYGVTCVNQPDTIADPTGGLVTDAEARTAINTIIDRLQELGLIA